MATKTEILTSTRELIGDQESLRFTDATLSRLMDGAIKRLSTIRRNYEKTVTQAVSLVGATALPVDFISMSRLEIASTGLPVWQIQPSQISHLKEPPVGDNPTYYYIGGTGINFWPAPLTAYNVKIRYFAVAPLLVNPTDIPDPSLGTEADEYIRFYITREVMLSDQDYEGYQQYQILVAQLETTAISTAGNPESYTYGEVREEVMQPLWRD